MKKIFFLFFINIIFSTIVFSQFDRNRIHYTVNAGLPSNEVYKIYADSIGYYWFATDRGVAKFNGYDFKSFYLNDSLPDIVIFDIQSDNKGRLWFMGLNAMLGYYDKGKFYKYKYNDKIKKYFAGTKIMGGQNLFYVDSAGNIIYTHFYADKVIKIDTAGNFSVLFHHKKLRKKYISKDLSIYTIKNKNSPLIIKVLKKDTVIDYKINSYLYNGIMANSTDLLNKNGILYFSFNDILFILYPNGKIKAIQNDTYINKLFLINNQIWLATLNGLYTLDEKQNKFINKEFFTNQQLSYLFSNQYNTYWVCTIGNGVYFYPSIESKTYSTIEEEVKAVNVTLDKKNNKHIFYVTNKYLHDYCNKNLLKYKITPSLITDNVVFDIISEDSLILNNQLYKIKNGKITEIPSSFARDERSRASKFYNNKYYNLTYTKLIIYDDFNHRKVYHLNNFLSSTFDISNDTVWLGTNEGIYTFNLKTNKINRYDLSELNYENITQLILSSDSLLIIGTKGKGIYIINKKNNKIIKHFAENFNLKGGVINKLYKYKKFIFIGSQNGIDMLDIKKLKLLKVKSILPKHCEIKDIKVYDSDLYIAYNKGLIKYPIIDLFSLTDNKKVLVTNVTINTKDTSILSCYKLKYYQNNINISIDIVDDISNKKFYYYYKLSKTNSPWIRQTNRTLYFQGLKPDTYDLLIKPDINSKKIKKLRFCISPPFWQRLSFKIALLIFVTISVALFFYLTHKKKLQTERNNLQMLSLRQKSLNKQLNPHFIFNALNSINNYILKHDTEKSSIYLSRFANLTRKVLENSQEQLISFQEEFDALKLYVDIEKLRFKEQINFIFDIDPKISLLEYKVPPLILQPYVENAIIHGVLPKKEKGTIIIRIKKENNNLCCYIIDDGIGYKNSQINKRKNKKSLAHKIELARIEIVNTIYKTNIKVEYLEVNKGTIVKLTIPKIEI